uniref:Uncharacterized protein n=1 Tax=Arcella intermedia TaxID=1963864 RepID=A0A6B2LI33_9EUKA
MMRAASFLITAVSCARVVVVAVDGCEGTSFFGITVVFSAFAVIIASY